MMHTSNNEQLQTKQSTHITGIVASNLTFYYCYCYRYQSYITQCFWLCLLSFIAIVINLSLLFTMNIMNDRYYDLLYYVRTALVHRCRCLRFSLCRSVWIVHGYNYFSIIRKQDNNKQNYLVFTSLRGVNITKCRQRTKHSKTR